MTTELPRLMLVTDRHRTAGRPLAPLVAAAVEGGVGIVQVREKDLDEVERAKLLSELRSAADSAPSPVRWLINGSSSVAETAGVGLHLPANAPAYRGERVSLIGQSAHDAEEAHRAVAERADLIVLGTIYSTDSKPGRPAAGVEHVRNVARRVAPVPVFAIGGLLPNRVGEVIAAGAWGVAVCSAILGARDPREAARAFKTAVENAGTGG